MDIMGSDSDSAGGKASFQPVRGSEPVIVPSDLSEVCLGRRSSRFRVRCSGKTWIRNDPGPVDNYMDRAQSILRLSPSYHKHLDQFATVHPFITEFHLLPPPTHSADSNHGDESNEAQSHRAVQGASEAGQGLPRPFVSIITRQRVTTRKRLSCEIHRYDYQGRMRRLFESACRRSSEGMD